MESVALSRTTRWGMLLTGLLQGVLCYLLMAWLVPQNSDWLACDDSVVVNAIAYRGLF